MVFSSSALAVQIPTDPSYTYDNTKSVITAPASHTLDASITGDMLGAEPLSDVSDIAVYNDKLYILEKTQGKIFVVNRDNSLSDILCEDMGLSSPESLFISSKGYIYIADTANGRILKVSVGGELIAEVTAPSKEETNSSVDFLPGKVVVDSGERLYIIVSNETNGIYQLDINGNFLGFYGSVPVVPDFTELFWRTFSTKEQLKKMLLFVPTEYSSMDIDNAGFIYTTVATNTDTEMRNYITSGGSDSTLAPIRRLNPKNIDVLVRTGSMPPAGDLINTVDWRTDSGNASRFVDISVKENGTYCALDSTRSRIFTYDSTGQLLYVFGNYNDTEDGLLEPNAICWWSDRIVVCDRGSMAVKVYKPTAYATLIDNAIAAETAGDYDTSYTCWQELLNKHSGNSLACIGMGKYYMRNGEYAEAMRWFQKVDSKENYSSALKQYRKEIGYTVTGAALCIIIAAIAVVAICKKLLKKRKDPDGTKKENPILGGFKYGFYIMRNPFDGFWDMRFEHKGNMISATVILALTVAFNLIGCFAKGYLIAGNRDNSFNLLIQGVLSILLPVLLWCVANWSVTSLMNGSGTFKDIYMYSCYSLTPLLFGMPLTIILSNVLTLDEIAFYTILNTMFYVWVGFLLFAGTLTVHQYTGSQTILSIVLIIVAMAIIIFVVLLCTTIVQQVTDFIRLLFEEIRLRK